MLARRGGLAGPRFAFVALLLHGFVTAALVGLGIRDLSVTPVAIPAVKESLSAIDSTRAAGLAARALDAAESSDVEHIFGGAS